VGVVVIGKPLNYREKPTILGLPAFRPYEPLRDKNQVQQLDLGSLGELNPGRTSRHRQHPMSCRRGARFR
jgi:hypothetical protein